MDIAALNVVLSVSGTNSVINSLTQVTQNIKVVNQAAKAAASDDGIGKLQGSFLSTFYGARALIAGFGDLVSIAGQVSGVDIAASYGQIQSQLEAVTGSSTKAAAALQAFSDIGGKTKFDTQDVAAFGSGLLAVTGDVEATKRDITGILDAAAASGLSRSLGNRFMDNLIQIRGNATPNLVDIRQMFRAAPGIGRVLGAATGQGAMDAGQVSELAKKMGGKEFFDLLVKAGSAPGVRGASERLGPLDFMGNFQESISKVMLPTGAIILAALMPLADFAKSLADLLGIMNRLTGGFGGLAVIIAGIVRGWVGITAAGRFAVNEVQRLVASIDALAVSSRAASGGGGGLSGGLGAVGGFVNGVTSFLKGPGPWAIGGIAASAAGEHLGPRSTAGIFLQNIGAGAGLGALIGSAFGPAGTAIGGLVGILGGEIKSFYDRAHRDDNKSPTDRLTDAIKENTEAQKVNVRVLGGGARGSRIAGQLEAERLRAMFNADW